MPQPICSPLVYGVLLLAAGTAGAQSASQSIEVRGANALPLRTDLNAVCPEARVQLPDTLARVAREGGQPAVVDVQFVLDGRRVQAIEARGGPRAYRAAVRWAVRGLACDNAGAGQQRVTLRVRFVDPDLPAGRQAVALL